MNITIKSKEYSHHCGMHNIDDEDVLSCLRNSNAGDKIDSNNNIRLLRVTAKDSSIRYFSWRNLQLQSNVLTVCERDYPEYMI